MGYIKGVNYYNTFNRGYVQRRGEERRREKRKPPNNLGEEERKKRKSVSIIYNYHNTFFDTGGIF